jgi:hypothetical protein
MLRTRLSWLVIGGVAVILVAAAVDALRSSGSKTPSTERGLVRDGEREGQPVEEVPLAAAAETGTGPLERCTAGQLALRVESLGGTHLLALAHVWGSPCRTARIPIQASVLYGKGNPVNPDKASAGVWPQAFAPTDLSPGVEVIAEVQMSYLCGTRRPRLLVAEARPYVARKWLPRGSVACLDDVGP